MNAQENACPLATALAEFTAPSWESRERFEAHLISAIDAADHASKTLAIHQLALGSSEEGLAEVARTLLLASPVYSLPSRRHAVVDAFLRLPTEDQRTLLSSIMFFLEGRLMAQVEEVVESVGRARG